MLRTETGGLRHRLARLEARDRDRSRREQDAMMALVDQWSARDPEIAATLDRYYARAEAAPHPPADWPTEPLLRAELTREAVRHGFDAEEAESARVLCWQLLAIADTPEAQAVDAIFKRARREVRAPSRGS